MKKLKDIFIKQFQIKDEKDVELLSFNSINKWDSLNHIKLIIHIEKIFNINVKTHQISELNSYKKIEEYLKKLNVI